MNNNERDTKIIESILPKETEKSLLTSLSSEMNSVDYLMKPTDDALVCSNFHHSLKEPRERNGEGDMTRIFNTGEGQITPQGDSIKVKMKLVYVISKNGNPLMPCSVAKARRMLKKEVARIVKYEPFTIQLEFDCKEEVQDIVLGVDSGSKKIGLSATTDKKELYSAEVKLRNDIVKLMSERRMCRRTRRDRKTRYREARFLNRKVEKGWLAPSVRSKIDAHLKQIEEVNKLLPISKTIVEVASFDIQKIKNPEIQGEEYQQGEMYGWNAREYVLWRDNHKCQGKKGCKNKILITHHIESRQVGGNAPNNLITLCKECHDDYHSGKLKKEFKRDKSFRNETFMGIMRWRLYDKLKEKYFNVNLTYGYITKNIRINNELEKSHRTDALCIAGNIGVDRLNSWFQIRQVRKKKRSLHEVNPLKFLNGKRRCVNTKLVVKKEKLWCLMDKVKLDNRVGWISGFCSGKRVYVKDIESNSLSSSYVYGQINPNKLELINRNNNWIYDRQQ